MASNIHRKDLGDGQSLLVVGYDESDALSTVEQKLTAETETPTPTGDGDGGRDGGPIRRFTDRFATLRLNHLRRVSLQGHEVSDAIRTRRDELYRNEFPVLKPRFRVKCKRCESEFDSEPDECPACGHDGLRRPDPEEKREADRLFESVNREGQSLRELAKSCEPDQWLAGVSVIILRYDYTVSTDSQLVEDGTILNRQIDELVRADPAQVVPVVNENGRIGGHWYTCPIHRSDPAESPGRCDKCNAELRDVHFVEEGSGDNKRFYFADEIVTWAYPYPRLGGLDGLAPAAVVWLRQVILEMMDHYGAAYYDTSSDRLPNQFMILHTTNPDHWEEQLSQARGEDDAYDAPIFSNEYSPQDSSTPEVQVIDAMPDELLGQNQQIKQDYKEDIRQAFGISNIHDSDLSDAGGLNNEGLQLEVTDRSIASQQHDYVEGWLDTLGKRLGIDDWRIEFLPSTGPDAKDLQEEVRAGALASRAGLEARIENGSVEISDGKLELEPGDPGPGQVPDPADPQAAGSGGDDSETPDTPADEARGQKADVASEALKTLQQAYQHIVWADGVEQKAEPFFDDDGDVPQFVKELVNQAIRDGAIHTAFDNLPASARGRLANIFKEKLTQPQGWSLDSLASDLEDEFALSRDDAETIARGEVKSINDHAREVGYERQGLSGESEFKWLGPVDGRKHSSCQWLIGGDSLAGTNTGFEGTNPDYGGSPVPLDELRDLVQEANDRFVEGHEARRYTPHIGCRDTYVQHYDT